MITFDSLKTFYNILKINEVTNRNSAIETALTTAKSYADTAVSNVKNDLLNGAGAAYDTLKELGDLIDDNTDAIDALEAVASNKVDKIEGKSLSTNDFTNEEKEKLALNLVSAEVIETIELSTEYTVKVNGVLLDESGVLADNTSSTVLDGEAYQNDIQVGMAIMSFSVTMSGIDITDLYVTFDGATISINIPAVTGNIEIYYEAD